MTRRNGTIWKVVAAVVSVTLLAIAIGGLVWDASGKSKDIGQNHKEIEELKPKVEANTKHRDQSEIYQEWMKERMEKLEEQTDKILQEVQK